MEINYEGLKIVNIIGAVVLLAMSIVIYPTLKEQSESKHKSSKK